MHPELKLLADRLRAHDWHHALSDDPRKSSEGRQDREQIRQMVIRLGYGGRRLFNAYREINFNPATGMDWTDQPEPIGKRLVHRGSGWEFDES